MARLYSLRIGQRLKVSGWPQLTVTGFYRIPDVSRDYWFSRGPAYFPMELGPASNNPRAALNASTLDAFPTSYPPTPPTSPPHQRPPLPPNPLTTNHVQ